jgi:hypothetical protein
MKVYWGTRISCSANDARGEPFVAVEVPLRSPTELTHIPFHSPDGFEWGYAGSGPADLALALLADHFEEPPEYVLAALRSLWAPRSKAAALHRDFKREFVTHFNGDEWRLDSEAIDAWLATSAIQARLQELARENTELNEIRRLDEAAETASASTAD